MVTGQACSAYVSPDSPEQCTPKLLPPCTHKQRQCKPRRDRARAFCSTVIVQAWSARVSECALLAMHAAPGLGSSLHPHHSKQHVSTQQQTATCCSGESTNPLGASACRVSVRSCCNWTIAYCAKTTNTDARDSD